MIDLLILILACVSMGYVVQSRTAQYNSARIGISHDLLSKLLYFAILLSFTLFAGLRSKYNDTGTYIYGYRLVNAEDLNLKVLTEAYGGFELYQRLIKRFISAKPQVFIFITAVFTTFMYLSFYSRHTRAFGGMIFFFAIGAFISSMAALKQSIAIAIGLYAINNYLNKKYVRSLLLLLLAMTFHPYIICLICVPMLKGRVWDGRTVLLIAICAAAFMNLDKMLEAIKVIGKDYSNEAFNDYTINPVRVLVEAIPIVLSIIYRKQINETKSTFLVLGINMRIISFAFVAMGLFANPIYFGRMSSYFSCLSAIAIPEMLTVCWGKKRIGKALILGYYVFFFLYFLMDMTKIGSISIFKDQFEHVKLSSLF